MEIIKKQPCRQQIPSPLVHHQLFTLACHTHTTPTPPAQTALHRHSPSPPPPVFTSSAPSHRPPTRNLLPPTRLLSPSTAGIRSEASLFLAEEIAVTIISRFTPLPHHFQASTIQSQHHARGCHSRSFHHSWTASFAERIGLGFTVVPSNTAAPRNVRPTVPEVGFLLHLTASRLPAQTRSSNTTLSLMALSA